MGITKYESIIAALQEPQAYPERVDAVERVETHISHLFMTGEHVYKVKKPVDYGFLDFTTLEKRRYYCHREVELNRRLSPEMYLGVVEIREQSGDLLIEGPGRTVEFAVKMLQLPRERSMSRLLRQGQVSREDVRRLAHKIADFHRVAETGPEITPLGSLEVVRENIQENSPGPRGTSVIVSPKMPSTTWLPIATPSLPPRKLFSAAGLKKAVCATAMVTFTRPRFFCTPALSLAQRTASALSIASSLTTAFGAPMWRRMWPF